MTDVKSVLYDNAVKQMRAEEVFQLLQEKLEQMHRDCETMFAAEERAFAEECFDLLRDTEAEKKQYLYQKGLLDCVILLKSLGVLA